MLVNKEMRSESTWCENVYKDRSRNEHCGGNLRAKGMCSVTATGLQFQLLLPLNKKRKLMDGK